MSGSTGTSGRSGDAAFISVGKGGKNYNPNEDSSDTDTDVEDMQSSSVNASTELLSNWKRGPRNYQGAKFGEEKEAGVNATPGVSSCMLDELGGARESADGKMSLVAPSVEYSEIVREDHSVPLEASGFKAKPSDKVGLTVTETGSGTPKLFSVQSGKSYPNRGLGDTFRSKLIRGRGTLPSKFSAPCASRSPGDKEVSPAGREKESKLGHSSYDPSRDSSDTDSTDTPSSSVHTSPALFSKARPNRDANIVQSEGGEKGETALNVAKQISTFTGGDGDTLKMAVVRPCSMYPGPISAVQTLMRESFPEVPSASNSKSFLSDLAGVSRSENNPGAPKLFSTENESVSNRGVRDCLKSNQIRRLAPLQSKGTERCTTKNPDRKEMEINRQSGVGGSESKYGCLDPRKLDMLNDIKRSCHLTSDPLGGLPNQRITGCESKLQPEAIGNLISAPSMIGATTLPRVGFTGSVGHGNPDKESNQQQVQSSELWEKLNLGTSQQIACPRSVMHAPTITNPAAQLDSRNAANLGVGESKLENLPAEKVFERKTGSVENRKIGTALVSEKSANVEVETTVIDDLENLDAEFRYKDSAQILMRNTTGLELAFCNSEQIKTTSQPEVPDPDEKNKKMQRDSVLNLEVNNLKKMMEVRQNRQFSEDDLKPTERPNSPAPSDRRESTLVEGPCVIIDKPGNLDKGRDEAKNPRSSLFQKKFLESKFSKEATMAYKQPPVVDSCFKVPDATKEVPEVPKPKVPVREFDQTIYVHHFLEVFKQYKLDDILTASFDALFTAVQNSVKRSTGLVGLPWWNLLTEVKSVFEEFKTKAEAMEGSFKANTCFPEAELNKKLNEFMEVQSKVPANLPSPIREFVQQRIKACKDEYHKRNKLIRDGELKAYEALVKVAADEFFEELKFLVGDKYCGQNWFNALREQVSDQIKRHFIAAASFAHPIWKNSFTERLDLLTILKYKEVELIHISNGNVLEEKLTKIKEEILQVCGERLSLKIASSLIASEYKFEEVCTAWKKESLDSFISAVQKQIGDQYKPFVTTCEGHFKIGCNNLADEKRKARIKEIDKANEERQKKAREQKERQKLVDEKCKSSAKAKHKNDEWLQKAPQMTASSTKQKGLEEVATTSGHNTRSKTSHKESSSKGLPFFDVAIYFGLNRTLAGTFNPGTGEFVTLADVQNILYFDSHQIVAFTEEERRKCSHGHKVDFSCYIIDNNIDHLYDIPIQGQQKPFRIENFISFLFAAIKWRSEIILRGRIRNSVICLPQCFNYLQRRAVENGAELAGFWGVSVISDTNAIALAFMLKNRVTAGSVVAANAGNIFIDAGLFRFEKGIMNTVAISGHHFHQERKAYHLSHHTPRGSFYSQFGKDEKDKLRKIFSFDDIIDITASQREYIIAGANDFVSSKIEKVLPFNRIYLDETESLVGACCLAALYDEKSTTRERWNTIAGENQKTSWAVFLRELLSEDVKKTASTLNPPKGACLPPQSMSRMKQNFFLQNKATFHERRMRLLEDCIHLKGRISKLSGVPHDDMMIFQAQVESIETGILLFDSTVLRLKVVEDNLGELMGKINSLNTMWRSVKQFFS